MRALRVPCAPWIAVVGTALLLLPTSLRADSPRTEQAVGSRIVLELPSGYTPSSLFSGFSHEGSGVAIVVTDMPAQAYDEVTAGFAPEALAKRGIVEAARGTLARKDTHVYMRARQKAAGGDTAKFFVVFKGAGATGLVTVNVPQAAIDKGEVAVADVERLLASARLADVRKPAAAPFTLGHLGPFKDAGALPGGTRAYTLDGRVGEPPHRTRPVLMVAPALHDLPIGNLERTAEHALSSLEGIGTARIAERRRLAIAGLDGVELVGEARLEGETQPVAVWQTLLARKQGGYYRLVSLVPAAELPRWLPELRRIAEGFAPAP